MRKLSLDHFKLPQGQKYHIYSISSSEVSQQLHSHEYYQICYVERGTVEHRQEQTSVTLVAGDAFVVPPGFVHRLVFSDPGVQLYSLAFEESMFHEGFSRSNVYHFMTALKLEAEQPIPIRLRLRLDGGRRQTMLDLMTALEREQSATVPAQLSAAGSLVAGILCILSQAYFLANDQALQEVTETDLSMRACIDYIDSHFTQELTLEGLSHRFALSRSRFSLLFPQYTGTTLKRYISQKRIRYALTLLRTTELSVQSIAQLCGFEDGSTFYRNFVKVTGQQPSQYRSKE